MTQGDDALWRYSPIKQSFRAKPTSSRVAVEWREGWTKDAGWREEDIFGRTRGGMAEERGGGGKRHGLINVRQRDREDG